MRSFLLLALVACTAEVEPSTPPYDPLETIWAETIHAGDVIVAVPGTGTYSTFGKFIEDMPADAVVDGWAFVENVEVLEAAIAAADRAGVRAGDVVLGIWGAGITRPSFRYKSLTGDVVTFEVIGGTSVCANGGAFDNLLNYNAGNAEIDARDLHRRMRDWLANKPSAPRTLTFVSHSWGGAVAEYYAANATAFIDAHGALPNAELELVVAGGVPGFVPGFAVYGSGFRTVGTAFVYEVNRPDDPVHTFDPRETGQGHHYIVRWGGRYIGWYGITTNELSCGDVPGVCPKR